MQAFFNYLSEHAIILALTIVYTLFCLGVGWYFKNRASQGLSDYYVAKRKIPGWVVSLAFFSTFASTNTYIGQAGKAFQLGLSWAWVGLFWAIFCVISWLVLGPKMRNQTALLNSFTIPDYFHFRYKSDLAKSMRFAMIWTPIFLGVSLICVMGLGALVHGMTTEEEAAYLIHHTDEVVGFMLAKFDQPLVSGLCIAGLFAAGMSSLASVMLIVGTAAAKDIVHVFKPMSDVKIVRQTKWSIFFYCLIVFAFTLYPPAGIVELTAFSGAVFAASFFPAIFGGLYLKWGTDTGALASMIAGILANLIWRFGFRFRFEGLQDIHEVMPSFVVSFIIYLGVSKWTSHRIPDSPHLSRLFG